MDINESKSKNSFPLIEINLNNIAEIPDGTIESAMNNSTLRKLSCDEENEQSDEGNSDSALDERVNPDKKQAKRLKPPAIFRCEICLLELENATMLKEHLDGHDFQYSCKTCDAKVKLTLDFIDHVREHSTDHLYNCPLCEFAVEKRTKMTAHLQSKHDQFKKFRCEICKKGMNVYTQFLEHKFIHTDEKPFKCDKCDSSFAQNVSLHAHQTRMHIHEPISCDVCQKICRNKVELRSHKTSHVRKPATCEECGKTLSSKDKLRIHKRIHTGEKPYTCSFCPKSFKTSSFRTDHERIHTGYKPHVCPICKRGFSQRTSMKIHQTTHRTDKPYECTLCGKQFKSRIMLNGHVRKCSTKSVVQPQVNQEVGCNNRIGRNSLREDIDRERYGMLTKQDLNHVNEAEQMPWYEAHPNNYYNPTIPQMHYSNVVAYFEPSNSYVQLEMWDNQNGTSQVGNSEQTYEMNHEPELLPVSFQQHDNSLAGYYESLNQLLMQIEQQVFPSEMDNPQQNQQENQ